MNLRLMRMLMGGAVVFENEGAGGGGGGGGGAGGTGEGGTGGGGGWTPPEGLPEAYRGTDAADTLSKLLGGFNEVNTRADGLRTQLAQLPKAPDKPEAYTFTPSEKLSPYFKDLENNPALNHARQAFHKHGIPDKAFGGVIEDLYGPMIDAGLLPPPYDPATELKTFAQHHGLDQAGATRALQEAEGFATGLASQLEASVPEPLRNDVKATIEALTDTAAGNALLRALAGRLNDNGIRIPQGSTGGQQGLTVEDLRRLDADPRIDPNNTGHQDPNKRFDADLRKRYDEGYKRLSGQMAKASF